MRLGNWLLRRCSSQQWAIDSQRIEQRPFSGIRPRVLLSRELCLHFCLDLTRVPASKRNQSLLTQLTMLSPFTQPGHYASWQGGLAQLWIWDAGALHDRLPQSRQFTVLPDSALALAGSPLNGERWVAGLHGCEWQLWREGALRDSRWQASPPSGVEPLALDLSQRSPLQAADKTLMQQLALGGCAALLLASLLLQGGAWVDLDQSQAALQTELDSLEQDNQLQAQARRRAMQAVEHWQARATLFELSQSELIGQVSAALPESASLWQRYDYQPGRLQIFLRDPSPDPREYVTRLNATGRLTDVQVQPEPRNDMVTLQANPVAGARH